MSEIIRFTCGSCQSNLKVSAEHAGKGMKCPKCAEKIRIPSPATQKAAPKKKAPEPEAVRKAPAKTAPSKRKEEPRPVHELGDFDDYDEEDEPAPKKKARPKPDREEDDDDGPGLLAKFGMRDYIGFSVAGLYFLLFLLAMMGVFSDSLPEVKGGSAQVNPPGGGGPGNPPPGGGRPTPVISLEWRMPLAPQGAGGFEAVASSRNGKFYGMIRPDTKTVQVWNAETRTMSAEFPVVIPEFSVYAGISLSKSGKFVAFNSEDAEMGLSLEIHNMLSGRRLYRSNESGKSTFCFSPDEKVCVISYSTLEDKIMGIDTSTGDKLFDVELPKIDGLFVRIFQPGAEGTQEVLIGTDTGDVIVINSSTGKVERQGRTKYGKVRLAKLGVSWDGSVLAISTEKGLVLADYRSMSELASFDGSFPGQRHFFLRNKPTLAFEKPGEGWVVYNWKTKRIIHHEGSAFYDPESSEPTAFTITEDGNKVRCSTRAVLYSYDVSKIAQLE